MSNPFSRKPKWGQMETATVTPIMIKPSQSPIANVEDKKTVVKYIIPVVIVFGCLAAVAIISIIILVVKSRFKKAASSKPSKVYTPGAKVKEIEEERLLPEDVQTPPEEQKKPKEEEKVKRDQDLQDVVQVAKSLGISEPKRIPAIKVMMEKFGTKIPQVVKVDFPEKEISQEPTVEKPVRLLSYRELKEDYEKKKKPRLQEVKTPDVSSIVKKSVEEPKPEEENIPESQKVNTTASYLSTLVTSIVDSDAEIGVVEECSQSSEGEGSELEDLNE